MRIMTAILSAFVMLALAAPVVADAEESALCPVCALSGETEPHGVATTREYKGATYSFCAKQCAQSFDEDPAAYVFTPGPAPKLTLTSTTGAALSPGAPGQVTLIDFWATFCKPCVKSMPELDALHRDFSARGVAVIGISTDTGKDRAKKVKKFLEKNRVSYPIAVDREESPAWEAYHVKVLSTLYLVDRGGIIVRRWTGDIDMGEVRRAVQSLLDEGGADGSR
jgi:peroxiredoxin/YHS domain-containing protein